jgi:hypothetical protein
MFAKLVVLIIGIGLTASCLLAARQMRTQAAHELAQARLRVMKLDNERWKLRSDIAARITPEHVQEMASRLSPLKPIAGEFPAPVAAASATPAIPRVNAIASAPERSRPPSAGGTRQ